MAPTAINTTESPLTRALSERRAGVRRDDLNGTIVTLWGITGTNNHPCQGVLLNLGQGGLACRVTGAQSSGFIVGTTVRLAFSVDAEPGDINVAARIVSVTGASTPDIVVLGLEFEPDAVSQTDMVRRTDRSRIGAALNGRPSPHGRSEKS